MKPDAYFDQRQLRDASIKRFYLKTDPQEYREILGTKYEEREGGGSSFWKWWERYEDEYDVTDLIEDVRVRTYENAYTLVRQNPMVRMRFKAEHQSDLQKMAQDRDTRKRVIHLTVNCEVNAEAAQQTCVPYENVGRVTVAPEGSAILCGGIMEGVGRLNLWDVDVSVLEDLCRSRHLGEVTDLSFFSLGKEDVSMYLADVAHNSLAFDKLEVFDWSGRVKNGHGFLKLRVNLGRRFELKLDHTGLPEDDVKEIIKFCGE